VLFGAAALGSVDQDTADEIFAVLRTYGINHLDTAASYGDSELRIAPWLVGRRDEYFVATKTGERTGTAARAELERSLTRLGTDHVDLVQLHNLVEPEEMDTVYAPGGALEALCRARDEGLVRAIGVTGHGLRIADMHLRSLQRFDYDSVLLPYNFTVRADDAYCAASDALIELCAERNVAVQAIKAVARRRWPAGDETSHRSWYEPLADPGAVARAVRYVLAQDGLFLNSSSDFHLLPLILEAASSGGGAPSDDELRADTESFGIVSLFDGAGLERI
jgi:aryl-alcohol dehydrogenase-like predicted oxidoreductase